MITAGRPAFTIGAPRVAGYCGIVAAALGCAVLAGWHLGLLWLVRLGADLIDIRYVTALALACCGAALWGAAHGRRRWPAALALLVVALGAATVAEYVWGLDLRIDHLVPSHGKDSGWPHPGRMAPTTALAFLLVGSAILVASLRTVTRAGQVATTLAGCAVVGLAAVALVGYATGVSVGHAWGEYVPMAIQTALGFLVLGVGVTALAAAPAEGARSGAVSWLAVGSTVGGLVFTSILWSALIEERDLDNSLRIESDASLVAVEVAECVTARTSLLRHAAREWNASPEITRVQWEAAALRYIDDFEDVHAIAWVVPGSGRRWIVPEADALSLDAIELTLSDSAAIVPDALRGGADLLVVLPLTGPDGSPGALVALSYIDDVFEEQFANLGLSDHLIRLFDHGREVLRLGPAGAVEPLMHSRSMPIDAPPLSLSATVSLTQGGVASQRSSLPLVVLYGGAAMSSLLGLSLQLAIRARMRRNEAHENARRLSREVEGHNATSETLRESLRRLEAQNVELAAHERGLRESEAKFRLLFERTADALLLLDTTSGRFTEGNDAAVRMLALTGRSDLVSLRPADISPPFQSDGRPSHDKALDMISAAIANGSHRFEWTHCSANRSEFPVEVLLTPIEIDGRTMIVATCRDTTDRKQVEEERRRLAAIVENTTDLVGQADSEGRLTYVNPAGLRMLGVDRLDEVVGRPVSEFHTPASAARVLSEGIPTALRDGSWTGETEILGGGGRCVPVSQLILAGRGSDGSVTHTTAIMRDLSDRKQADDDLRASEERFRRVVENISDGIIVDDAEGRVAFANTRFFEIFGIAPGDARDLRIEDYVAPSTRPALRERHDRRMRGEDVPSDVEFEGVHSDGTPRWIEGRVVLLRDAAGEIVGTQSALRDVTGRRAAALALRESETRFVQAQKMEAVGRLAGGVAHDFNNLLTVIQGYGSILARKLRPEDAGQAALRNILDAAQRAEQLTRQLLAFSRKQAIQPRVLDLNAVVSSSVRLLRTLIGEDVEIAIDLDRSLGHVLADEGQISQVIMNLAVNARDAMPNGGTLAIKTRNRELGPAFVQAHRGSRPGQYVELTVTDTGCGMTPEVAVHVFEPFFTTKEVGKGTGLGLAMVYGIVKQNGGYIDIESVPGRGTGIHIYWPRVDIEAVAVSGGAPAATAPARGETVLVAEDEEPLRELVCSILETGGYTVLSGTSPADVLAVAQAHRGRIDILVTDVVMPTMPGPEVVKRLRVLRPDVRVLYMSGHIGDQIDRRIEIDERTAFLQKPFTPETLLGKVREVLDAPTRHR